MQRRVRLGGTITVRDWLVNVVLAILVYGASKIYAFLNHGPAVINVKTPFDDLIPVIPPFVIPYNSLEPLIYVSLVIFLLSRGKIFQSATLAMLLTWSISYAFYIFAQSYVERPTLTGTDVFTQMIREVYATDNPYNAFPSLHTSLSTIMAAHWLRLHRPLGLVISGWVVLIVLSTLFVKQHYIPDVLLGLVIAYGASAFFMNRLVGRAA